MDKDRIHIIAETAVGLDTYLFLDASFAVYVCKRETPLIASPIISWNQNEAHKFTPFLGEFSAQLALGFLSTLDSSYSVEKELLESIVAQEPRRDIVAMYTDKQQNTYFLDTSFNIFTSAKHVFTPYSPVNDPLHFNLQSYFLPAQLKDTSVFLDNFLPGTKVYEQAFEQQQEQVRKKRQQTFSKLAAQATQSSAQSDYSFLEPFTRNDTFISKAPLQTTTSPFLENKTAAFLGKNLYDSYRAKKQSSEIKSFRPHLPAYFRRSA